MTFRARIAPFALSLALLAPAATAAAAPQAEAAAKEKAASSLSLAELSARRDLWPEKVALKKDVRLNGVGKLAKGTEVRLQDLQGGTATVDAGNAVFDYPAADTDVLERARAGIAKMTPEQFALTEQSLMERTDLWPLQVALTAELGFTNGVTLPAGHEVVLRDLNKDGVWLADRKSGENFQAMVQETDLVRRARERLALPEKDRQPFFVRALEATIEKDGKIGAEGALAGVDLILVYKGRKGCTRCSAFVPELQKFYAKTKPENARFEVVFASQDATPQLAKEYMAEAKLPGLAIAQERNVEAANVASISGQLLPTVLLFDRNGKLLTRNHPNAGKPTGEDVLADVAKRLKG